MIIVDTREKPRAVVKILAEFEKQGVEYVRRALNFADYFNPDNPGIVIDRKQNLLEVCANVVQGSALCARLSGATGPGAIWWCWSNTARRSGESRT